MAALTMSYALSKNVKRFADFTFHRLQNVPESPSQYCRHYVSLSKVKPTKYHVFVRTPIRNFRSTHNKESAQGVFSQLFKPLCFTFGSFTLSAIMVMVFQRLKTPAMFNKTPRELYLQHLKVVIGIIGINCTVFLLWRVPRLHPFMSKYFTCATGNPVISMFLSSFSHTNFIHLLMNMYVFWSFSGILFTSIKQTEMFTWLYVNGAIISSLTSLMLKTARSLPIPSVGASGALLTCIACVCYAYPRATLGFPIISDLTGFYFTADTGLKGIILLDICGIIFRWKLLDHAGHLGGVLFGLWYMHYGRHLIKKHAKTVYDLQNKGKGK